MFTISTHTATQPHIHTCILDNLHNLLDLAVLVLLDLDLLLVLLGLTSIS